MAKTWWQVAGDADGDRWTGGSGRAHAGHVFEDGEGVVSHEVPPMSSSGEGHWLGAEGFVQSL